MPVFRVHKTENYTVMSNYHLRDKGLSLQAKGLLSVILSLPPDWNYSIHGLALINKEGDKAIKSTLDELKKHGYLIVRRINPEQGRNRVQYEYDVYEKPLEPTKPQVAEPYPSEGVQPEGVQAEGVPKGGQLSTDGLSTDSSNTDHSSKNSSDKNMDAIKAIVDHLNAVLGTSYTYRNRDTNRLINARLAEHYTIDDFKLVIDSKATEWRGTEWQKYLRPSTLFTASHFESYLNAARMKTTSRNSYSSFMDGWVEEYRGGEYGPAQVGA